MGVYLNLFAVKFAVLLITSELLKTFIQHIKYITLITSYLSTFNNIAAIICALLTYNLYSDFTVKSTNPFFNK